MGKYIRRTTQLTRRGIRYGEMDASRIAITYCWPLVTFTTFSRLVAFARTRWRRLHVRPKQLWSRERWAAMCQCCLYTVLMTTLAKKQETDTHGTNEYEIRCCGIGCNRSRDSTGGISARRKRVCGSRYGYTPRRFRPPVDGACIQ